MKKAILFVALAAGTAGFMTSCGKSSKGKLAAEWKLDSMTSTSTYSSGGTSTTSISGTTYTETSGSGTQTGTVKTASWTIEKDGTWTRTLEIEMTETFSGVTYTTNNKNVSEGTWDFLAGKTDEFKKNERVVFNTKTSTDTNVTTSGGVSNTTTETNTYLDGENSMIYVISESKKKSLTLTYSGSNTNTDNSGSSTSTYNETVNLTAE